MGGVEVGDGDVAVAHDELGLVAGDAWVGDLESVARVAANGELAVG
jgi:hypothetical protein